MLQNTVTRTDMYDSVKCMYMVQINEIDNV